MHDLGCVLWFSTDAVQKEVGDENVVKMERTEDGPPVPKTAEEPVGSFNKQLSAAELKEHRAVCRSEGDADGEARNAPAPATGTTGHPPRKSQA